MGKTETITCEYLRANDIFADVVNMTLYSGKNVVKAENISELDASYMSVIPDMATEKDSVASESFTKRAGNKNAHTHVRKYRDILRMVKLNGSDEGTEYCVRLISGIEQQTNVHYAMPVRDMLYDALEYAEQVKSKSKENSVIEVGMSEKRKLSHGEFLSGMRKGDKLIPVVTIVVYFQPEEWDGPKSLHEMLDFTGMPDEMIKRIPDYEMILLQPSDYEETFMGKLKSTLPVVLGLLKWADSKSEFKNYVDEHSDALEKLSYDAAAVINEYCNMGMFIPEEKTGEKEVINMCKAVEEIREEGRIEGERMGEKIGEKRGKIIGKIMAYMDMGVSIEEIAGKLHVTIDEVKQIAASMR